MGQNVKPLINLQFLVDEQKEYLILLITKVFGITEKLLRKVEAFYKSFPQFAKPFVINSIVTLRNDLC